MDGGRYSDVLHPTDTAVYVQHLPNTMGKSIDATRFNYVKRTSRQFKQVTGVSNFKPRAERQ